MNSTRQKWPLSQTVALLTAVLIALTTLNLSACARKPATPAPLSTLRVTTPLTASQQRRLVPALEKQDVQIIQQGSRLQLILPINQFFEAQTTTLKERHVKTLRLIALYLHNYTRTHVTTYPIKIYGYTGTVHTRQYRDAISNQYAQVIAAFLWNHGFSPIQMSVVGFGAKNPIASYRTSTGNAYNRRVMIQVNLSSLTHSLQAICNTLPDCLASSVKFLG